MSTAKRSHISPSRPGFLNFAEAITESDTAPSPAWEESSVIYVGTGGDVAVIPCSDTDNPADLTPVVFKNCPDGFVIPIHVIQVLSSGTTASDLVRLY